MKWTFGIITQGNTAMILKIVESIEAMKIPEYEVMVVGGESINHNRVRHFPFDESIKTNWITRKKNLIAENSKYENMVITHDYVSFKPDWYVEFLKFGDNWDVCMTKILNTDNRRFRDWVTWEAPNAKPSLWVPPAFVPYSDLSRTNKMYVPGIYFCVKKSFMCKHPLDETRSWGESEDGEWSCRVRDFWNYRCNPKSIVQFLKDKPHFPDPPEGE